MEPEKKEMDIVEFGLAFAMPTIIGKVIVLYFGMNYAAEPGKGYGYGLAIAVIFTITMIIRFLWRYRNYKD